MIVSSFLTLSRAKSLKESQRFEQRSFEHQAWERERELLFVRNEGMEKMTVGGKGYGINTTHITHKTVGSNRPRSLRIWAWRFRTGQNRKYFSSAAFLWLGLIELERCFEHLVPPRPLLVSPLIVRLVL